MDSPTVTDLYRRYKIGSKHVLQWLASTVCQSRKLSDVLPSANKDEGLSNKQKKKRRQHPPAKLILTAQDLVRLADAIAASSNPGRRAPPGLDSTITVLDSVISGRTECARWYKARAANDGTTSKHKDTSHGHFVEILRRVRTILAQVRQQSRPSKQKTDAPPTSPTATNTIESSIFAQLPVEVTNPLSCDDQVAADTPNIGGASAAAQFELETQEEDPTFALWCFLSECHGIRCFVRSVWSDFERGTMSLPTAASITAKAFILIQGLAAEFTAEFPTLNDFDKISQSLDLHITTVGGEVEAFSCKESKAAAGNNDEETDAAELLCVPALMSLCLLRLFVLAPAAVGTVRSDVAFEAIGDHIVAGNQFCSLVVGNMLEFEELRLRADRYEDLDRCDQFTNDVIEFIARPKLSLAFVVESQIYIDIHDTLGGCFGAVANILLASSELQKKSLSRSQEVMDSTSGQRAGLRSSTSSRHRDAITRLIHQGIERSDSISIHSLLAKGDDETPSIAPEQIAFLAHFPVLGGTVLDKIALHNHLDGLESCSCRGSLVALAHLYEVCRDQGYLRASWSDLEFVLQQQGRPKLGIRTAAISTKPILSASRNLGMALVVDIKEYTRHSTRRIAGGDPRVPLPDLRKTAAAQRIKGLDVTSPFVKLVQENLPVLQKLGFSRTNAIRNLLFQLPSRVLATNDLCIDESIRRQWQQHRKLTSLQLLKVFRQTTIEHEPHVNFDYQYLLDVCVKSFDTITDRWREVLGQLRAEQGLVTDPMLYELVNEVMWDAALWESTPRYRRGPDRIMLQHMADLLNHNIERSGSVISQRAKDRSSGHIADFFKPCDKASLTQREQDERNTKLSLDKRFRMQMDGDCMGLNSPPRSIEVVRDYALAKQIHNVAVKRIGPNATPSELARVLEQVRLEMDTEGLLNSDPAAAQ